MLFLDQKVPNPKGFKDKHTQLCTTRNKKTCLSLFFLFSANITPTVELNALVMKRSEPAKYSFVDPRTNPPAVLPAPAPIPAPVVAVPSVPPPPLTAGAVVARHPPPPPHPPPHPPPQFHVRLTVGEREFSGLGSTAQAAKHDAATNALRTLKVYAKCFLLGFCLLQYSYRYL